MSSKPSKSLFDLIGGRQERNVYLVLALPGSAGGGHADDLHRSHDGQVFLVQQLFHPVRRHLEVSLQVANVVSEMCAVQAEPVAVHAPTIAHRQRPHVHHRVHLIDHPPIKPFRNIYRLHGFHGLFTDASEHIRFLLFSFSLFHFFLVFGSMPQIKLTYVSF